MVTLNISYNVETDIFQDANSPRRRTVLIILGIPVFLVNFFAIVVLVRCEKLPIQVKRLSMNLAFADCLLGIALSIPDEVFTSFFSCSMKGFFIYLTFASSVFSSTMINLDRFFSIYKCMSYVQVLTETRLNVICSGIWIFSYCYSLNYLSYSRREMDCRIDFIAEENLKTVTTIIWAIPIMTNILIYIYIVRFLIKMPTLKRKGADTLRIDLEVYRAVRKVTFISGLVFVCTVPAIVCATVEKYMSSPIISGLAYVTRIVTVAYSFLNPFLYVLVFYEARYQLLKMLFFWKSEKLEKLRQDRQQYFATYVIASVRNNRVSPTDA